MKFRILLVLLTLVACRKPGYIYHPPEAAASAATVNDGRVLMVVFHIKTDDEGKNIITLVSKTFASGKIKSIPEDAVNPSTAVMVRQTDGSSNILQSNAVEHPLYKSTEYLKNPNEFARKQLVLKEADFFVRLTLLPAAVGLQVEEIQNNKKVSSVIFEIRSP